MGLRERAERDLAHTLEGRWSLPVNAVDPLGIRTEGIRAQVLYDIVRMNPDTGENMVVAAPVITLRRSTLARIPAPGENWFFEIPATPSETAEKIPYMMSPVRPPEGGSSLGFIRIYLQEVEQV